MVYQYKDVKEKELLIYSMKNTFKPIIKYSKMPLEKIDYAFVINHHDSYSFVF